MYGCRSWVLHWGWGGRGKGETDCWDYSGQLCQGPAASCVALNLHSEPHLLVHVCFPAALVSVDVMSMSIASWDLIWMQIMHSSYVASHARKMNILEVLFSAAGFTPRCHKRPEGARQPHQHHQQLPGAGQGDQSLWPVQGNAGGRPLHVCIPSYLYYLRYVICST